MARRDDHCEVRRDNEITAPEARRGISSRSAPGANSHRKPNAQPPQRARTGNAQGHPLRWPVMSTLTCPKCGNEMRSYERNRVLVDQCTGCGGLFLDRGELEGLIAAETAWHQRGPGDPNAAAAAYPGATAAYPGAEAAYPGGRPAYQGIQDAGARPGAASHVDPYGQPPVQRHAQAPYYATSKGYKRHKRRSFLSDLFDD